MTEVHHSGLWLQAALRNGERFATVVRGDLADIAEARAYDGTVPRLEALQASLATVLQQLRTAANEREGK